MILNLIIAILITGRSWIEKMVGYCIIF